MKDPLFIGLIVQLSTWALLMFGAACVASRDKDAECLIGVAHVVGCLLAAAGVPARFIIHW